MSTCAYIWQDTASYVLSRIRITARVTSPRAYTHPRSVWDGINRSHTHDLYGVVLTYRCKCNGSLWPCYVDGGGLRYFAAHHVPTDAAECMWIMRPFLTIAMTKSENSLWSFNTRSYNPCDFSDSEPDDPLLDNPCSDGSTLVDHPLSEGSDTAVFKPNPWSIARINAASRPAQKYAFHSRVPS